MGVPKKRKSRMRRDRRRAANNGLRHGGPQSQACTKCGAPSLPHRICGSCGFYAGREIVKVDAA